MSELDPAIVAAAQAIDWGTHEYRVDSPDWWVPSCRCGWKASAPYAVSEFDLHIAELAVGAAAPLIAAKALREAAGEVYGDERAKGPHSEPLSIASWLRARAEALEEQAPCRGPMLG